MEAELVRDHRGAGSKKGGATEAVVEWLRRLDDVLLHVCLGVSKP